MMAGGRKRQSPVWDHFEFNSETGKSKCIVTLNNTLCGAEIKGKNPTNLKVHLQTNHREEYKSFMAKDSERKTTIGNDKVSEGASSSQTQLQQQTLTLCFQKSEVWPTISNEHKKRENALVDLFVETGMSNTYTQTQKD